MGLFGSSGIRAVFDKDLLTLAFRAGLAVGAQYKNVVIGRDTRTSGDAMKHVVIAGLLAAVAVGLVLGVVAAVIPARQAARLQIVTALRYE